ncbi:hypothetical protein IW146_009319, partial [Coemansia sp. RSA 922]
MARKKSNAKKNRSKRSSASTSPTPTPVAISSAAPEKDVVDVSEPTQNGVVGDEESTETAEASEQPLPDSGKYAVDVAAELTDSGADDSTEDQLEDPFVYAERNDDQHESVAEDSENHQLHMSDHAPMGSGSVNMEDSQAELLSSNMDHSMYHSTIDHSHSDELHALESGSDDLSCLADHSADVVAAAAELSSNTAVRPYVISPSAFAKEDESEDVVYLRPESATEPTADAADVQESADSGAAAVASIVSSLVEAVAAAGLSVSTGSVALEAVESSGELLGERDMCSSGDLVSGGHSMTESFIHVEGSVGDACEHTADCDLESDCESKPEEQ